MMELLEGPLRNPRRLEEATRASKWARRALGFLWPFGGRYGELSAKSEVHHRSFFTLSHISPERLD
jgi:hypothetical protein